jgi:class 3 adenylate cyclase/tetratricopeptide (TPR) repeat protein
MMPPATEPSPRIVGGERRVITILFCDVVGSTHLAGQLDPEEWAEIMNEAFQYMIAPIQEYDGMVARLMGDAVLAFFGAPNAHEDDPQRAVLAGLAIINGMRPFIQQFNEEYGLEFNVRVGINTGPVVVGEIGSTLLQEYTAMGDAINLAARMEQTALPGTVQISEDTYRLVAPLFDVWELGGIEVKGKDDPVPAYRVLGVDPQPGRLRGIEGLETPLVGRARELARLSESLAGVAGGRGRIAFLLGEAGLGKSRLVAELRRQWRDRLVEIYGPTLPTWKGWLEFVAVSYGASRPYDMLKRQLRQYCNIRETDPPAVVHERLGRLVNEYPEDMRDNLYRYFGFLLGDTLPAGGPLPEGEAFKRELRAMLTAAAAYQSDQGPIVYVMDDLHWTDPASIDALTDLLALVVDRPMLFILALRPDWNSPGWQMFINTQLEYPDHCLTIFLEPLTQEDSRDLITALLGQTIPGRVVDAIQQKAEGNPLFIEEVARALLESGVVAQTEAGPAWRSDGRDEEVLRLISLPGNVQALMTARIDRLAPDVRRTLQLAAVIGRTFPQRVLQQLAGPGVAVAEQLQTLIGADLIRPTGSGDGEHTFLHALARDAAYETILLRQRRRTHRQVAEVIEATYPDRLEEEASRLAYHYAEARDISRAVHCYSVAGRTAAKIYAHAEAVEHLSRAIDLALGAPAAVDDATLIDLFLRRGRIHELEGQYDEALATYEALEELGRSRRNPRLELAGIPPQAILYVTPNHRRDADRGAERAARTLELARQVGDSDAEARAYWSRLLLHVNITHDLDQAIAAGERALALARDHDRRELLAYINNDLGRAYGLNGRMADAFVAFDAARDLWTELGNDHMLADTLAISTQGYFMSGRLAEAETAGRQGLALAHRICNQWGIAQNSYALAYVLLELGRFEEALELMIQSLATSAEAHFHGPGDVLPIVMAYTYGALLGAPGFGHDRVVDWLDKLPNSAAAPVVRDVLDGLLLALSGDPEAGLARVAALPGVVNQLAVGPELIFASLALLSIHAAAGHHARVLAITDEVAVVLDRLAMAAFRVPLLRFRAAAQRSLGDAPAAETTLRAALSLARQQGCRAYLWRVLADLADLTADPDERAALRDEARTEMNDLATSIDDPVLYAAFLAQPSVRALVGPAGATP